MAIFESFHIMAIYTIFLTPSYLFTLSIVYK